MQIDWFTFLAQIINFLILLYLLKRFLYRPILSAMSKREARIIGRLEAANAQSKQAAERADDYAAKITDLEAKREEILAETREQVDVERRSALAATRAAIEEKRRAWDLDVERDQAQFLVDVQKEVMHSVCDISRRVIADLANASLHEQLVTVFLERLSHLPDWEKEQLVSGLTSPNARATVWCSFDLGEKTKRVLADGIVDVLGSSPPLDFEVHCELVCGVVLATPERRIEWSADSYLSELVDRLTACLTNARETATSEVEPPQTAAPLEPMRTTRPR